MLKKILVFSICFNLITAPAFCVIRDDFVEKTLSDKKITKTSQYQIIKDTFAEQTLSKNSYRKINKTSIRDTFAESNTNKNQYIKQNIQFDEQEIKTSQKLYLILAHFILTFNTHFKKYLKKNYFQVFYALEQLLKSIILMLKKCMKNLLQNYCSVVSRGK